MGRSFRSLASRIGDSFDFDFGFLGSLDDCEDRVDEKQQVCKDDGCKKAINEIVLDENKDSGVGRIKRPLSLEEVDILRWRKPAENTRVEKSQKESETDEIFNV
jgi:hypothetical protein